MVPQEKLDELLENLRIAKDTQFEDALKSITSSTVPGTATSYQPFNLDPVGKLLLPEFTPFSNDGNYEVKTGESGDSYEYRAIVGKNLNKSGGAALPADDIGTGSQVHSGLANLQKYSFLTRKKFRAKHAPRTAIDWELYESSGPFNALGKTTIASLITAREIEERRILFDDSQALGAPAQPTGVAVAGGGSLANVAYTVKVIALNYHGWWYWLADGIAAADQVAATLYGLPGGAVQGESTASVASAAITPAANGHINMTVAPVKGAYAYLWIINTGGGAYKLGTVTDQPFATITTYGALTVAQPSADGSNFDLDGFPVVWDGLFAQICRDVDNATIGGPYLSLAGNGTPGAFTTSGSGCGVAEMETQLQALSRGAKVSPEIAVVGLSTMAAFSNVCIGSSAPAYRIMIDGQAGDGKVIAGSILAGIRNQYAGNKPVMFMPHQLMPEGKIVLYTKTIDYPNAGVGTNLALHCTKRFQQQFYALTDDVAPPGPWAIKSYGCPALVWPKACAILDDIAA